MKFKLTIPFESLKSDYAMEVVCRDIYGHVGIPIPPDVDVMPTYIEGFAIFEVAFTPLPSSVPDDPLDVEGIYLTGPSLPAPTPSLLTLRCFPRSGTATRFPPPSPLPLPNEPEAVKTVSTPKFEVPA